MVVQQRDSVFGFQGRNNDRVPRDPSATYIIETLHRLDPGNRAEIVFNKGVQLQQTLTEIYFYLSPTSKCLLCILVYQSLPQYLRVTAFNNNVYQCRRQNGCKKYIDLYKKIQQDYNSHSYFFFLFRSKIQYESAASIKINQYLEQKGKFLCTLPEDQFFFLSNTKTMYEVVSL